MVESKSGTARSASATTTRTARRTEGRWRVNDLTWYLVLWAIVTGPGLLIGLLGVFPKAGRSWWAALVPVYNIYVLVVVVARLNVFWFVLLFIPIVQLAAAILVNLEVARRFGKSESFGLGLTLLGFVFYPLLGFGSDRYQEGEAAPISPFDRFE